MIIKNQFKMKRMFLFVLIIAGIIIISGTVTAASYDEVWGTANGQAPTQTEPTNTEPTEEVWGTANGQ
ncbi:hypothetical protein A994_02658, partial [Methanobacterium formicicum DSM 3637]